MGAEGQIDDVYLARDTFRPCIDAWLGARSSPGCSTAIGQVGLEVAKLNSSSFLDWVACPTQACQGYLLCGRQWAVSDGYRQVQLTM